MNVRLGLSAVFVVVVTMCGCAHSGSSRTAVGAPAVPEARHESAAGPEGVARFIPLRPTDRGGIQAELWEALAIEIDEAPRSFRAGELVTIPYYIRNTSDKSFEAPKRLASILHTLQRLDGDGYIDALPRRGIYTGIPSGFGYNIDPDGVFVQGVVEAKQKYYCDFSTATQGFPPGQYRLYIDLRLYDGYTNLLEQKRENLDFELR